MPLALAIVMSIIFTIALYFASTVIIVYANSTLLQILPDYGIHDYQTTLAIRESLMPIGLIMLGITISLIIIGFISKKGWLSAAGSIAFYLPVFGTFSLTMFYLAGIGILRVLWIPLIETVPGVFELGNVVLLPRFILLESLWNHIIDIFSYQLIASVIYGGFILFGILIFTVGTATWFVARFRDQTVVTFGIYQYSRHPQYLGFLLWSYGFLLTTVDLPVAFGGLWLSPSLPWLIGFFIILAVAIQEEISMAEKYGEEYTAYRETAPFLFPIPKFVSHALKTPIGAIFKKSWPEKRSEIAVIGLLYLVILIILSIPFALNYGFYL
ncbi:MAG: methyltransferase family protein [Candidatus Thorarchaeota archaeon]